MVTYGEGLVAVFTRTTEIWIGNGCAGWACFKGGRAGGQTCHCILRKCIILIGCWFVGGDGLTGALRVL